MKIYLNCAILAAVLMSFCAAAGWGETISANVPFGFHVNNKELPAGEYSVKQLQPGSPVLLMSNWQAHKSAMVLAYPFSAPAGSHPRMIFRCGDHGCSLAEVWGATSSAGVRLLPPRPSAKERERLAVVYFQRKGSGK